SHVAGAASASRPRSDAATASLLPGLALQNGDIAGAVAVGADERPGVLRGRPSRASVAPPFGPPPLQHPGEGSPVPLRRGNRDKLLDEASLTFSLSLPEGVAEAPKDSQLLLGAAVQPGVQRP